MGILFQDGKRKGLQLQILYNMVQHRQTTVHTSTPHALYTDSTLRSLLYAVWMHRKRTRSMVACNDRTAAPPPDPTSTSTSTSTSTGTGIGSTMAAAWPPRLHGRTRPRPTAPVMYTYNTTQVHHTQVHHGTASMHPSRIEPRHMSSPRFGSLLVAADAAGQKGSRWRHMSSPRFGSLLGAADAAGQRGSRWRHMSSAVPGLARCWWGQRGVNACVKAATCLASGLASTGPRRRAGWPSSQGRERD